MQAGGMLAPSSERTDGTVKCALHSFERLLFEEDVMSLRSRRTLPLLRPPTGRRFVIPDRPARCVSSLVESTTMRPSIDECELGALLGWVGLDRISSKPDSVVVVLERAARAEWAGRAVA